MEKGARALSMSVPAPQPVAAAAAALQLPQQHAGCAGVTATSGWVPFTGRQVVWQPLPDPSLERHEQVCTFATQVPGAAPVPQSYAHAAYLGQPPEPGAVGGYATEAAPPQAFQQLTPARSAQQFAPDHFAGQSARNDSTPSLAVPGLAVPFPTSQAGSGASCAHIHAHGAEGCFAPPQGLPTHTFRYAPADEAHRNGRISGARVRISGVSSIAADPLGASGDWASTPEQLLSPQPPTCTVPPASAACARASATADAGKEEDEPMEQHAEVPTPARSGWRRRSCPRRRRDMAVQANRDSIDHHAARRAPGRAPSPREDSSDEDRDGRSRSAGPDHRSPHGGAPQALTRADQWQGGPRRPRLVSIIKREGVPDNFHGALDDAPGPGPGVQKVALEKVEYPELQRRPAAEPSWRLPEGLGRRAAMGVALSEAIAEELEALRLAWGARLPGARGGQEGADQQKPTQKEAYFDCLVTIAKRAERACVMLALRPSPEDADAPLPGSAPTTSESEAALLARRARLQKELAETHELEQAMRKLDEEITEAQEARQLPAFCGGGLEDLIARLSAQSHGVAPGFETSEEFKGRAEHALRRLALVELWLGGTQLRLEEVKHRLDERERAASERAFAHVPDLEADPRSVFLKFA